MQLSQIPTQVPLPFAANGTKNTIPEASQIGVTPGAASLNDGFPPLTFTPLAAGGVPPSGADFNGILNLLSANTQWANAGGFYEFNSSFASSIDGYPKSAILAKSSGQGYWLNLEDNNSNDPDTGGAGWLSFDPWAIQSARYFTAKDTGTANAYAVTLSPVPSALTPGMLVNILQIANTNTGTATLAVNGLSTLPILLAKGTALSGGELTAGYGAIVRLNNAGTAWELVFSAAGEFVPPATQNNAAVQLGQITDGSINAEFGNLTATGSTSLQALQAANVLVEGKISFGPGGHSHIYEDSIGNGPGDIVIETGTGSTANFSVFTNTGGLNVPGEITMAPATQNNAAVQLGQFQYFGGNGTTSSTDSASTSVSFTPDCNGNVIVSANGFAGGSSNGTSNGGFTVSGGTIQWNAVDWNEGSSNASLLFIGFAIISASANTPITITFSVSNSTSSDSGANLIYSFIPTP